MADATPDPTVPPLDYTEFDTLDVADWRQLAAESNSGKPFEKLTTPTVEGITIQPFYTADDVAELTFPHTSPGFPPYVRGLSAAGYLQQPWLVAQELAYPTPSQLNRALLDDLDRGQTVVNILLDDPTRSGLDPDQARPGEVGRGGLSLATVKDVAATLAGVNLAATPLMVRAGTVALPLLALLVGHVRRQGNDTAVLHGWLEDDPLGVIAHQGTLPVSLWQAYDEMANLTRWAADHAPRLGTIAVHTYPYHSAGAHAVQELAFALATGAAYLRELSDRGVPIAMAAPRLRFDLSIGSQFFPEIAKFRAARLLWSQVVEAFGGDTAAQRLTLHARTGRYDKTLTDPHVNMLRVTTQALSAALGGVDSLHVSPYDEPARLPNDFSRRIARNVQIILQSEVHLTQLVDPAGGTWAVEALVNEMAQRAWALFQRIEADGGMWAALQSGLIQSEVGATHAARAANLAQRREVIVGTNQYANPAEQPLAADTIDYKAVYRERAAQLAHHRSHDDDPSAHVAALERLGQMLDAPPEQMVESAIAAAQAGATLNEITRTLHLNDRQRPTITPLTLRRASEPWEALRDEARAFAAANGRPPRVFLAAMGPLRQHKARADFAQGFFEPGGFEVITPAGLPTAEDAAAAALAAEADAVVVCSTDETYPVLVPPLAAAIRAAKPAMPILVAGRPGDHEAAYRTAGVTGFIYLGADCLAANRLLLDAVGRETQPS